ncbi:MAG: hypothetical protein ABFD96_25045 [Armatimonadia bacterium]
MTTAEQIQDEISALLRRLAEPVTAGESVKACIRRASMRSGLPFNQTKRLWYREWGTIPAHVADNIRQRASAHDRRLKQAAYQAVVALQDSDPEFYRDCIEDMGEILLPERGKVGPSGPRD